MAKVYVVQQHLAMNRDGILAPKFNLEPAKEFGELVFCLHQDTLPQEGQSVLDQLRKSMEDIQEGDFILPIGSTILMCLASVVASEFTGKLNFLYWSNRHDNYRAIRYNLEEDAYVNS